MSGSPPKRPREIERGAAARIRGAKVAHPRADPLLTTNLATRPTVMEPKGETHPPSRHPLRARSDRTGLRVQSRTSNRRKRTWRIQGAGWEGVALASATGDRSGPIGGSAGTAQRRHVPDRHGTPLRFPSARGPARIPRCPVASRACAEDRSARSRVPLRRREVPASLRPCRGPAETRTRARNATAARGHARVARRSISPQRRRSGRASPLSRWCLNAARAAPPPCRCAAGRSAPCRP